MLESSFFVLMEWVFYDTNKRFSHLNHEVIIVNYLRLLQVKRITIIQSRLLNDLNIPW